ncbi:MAG: folylpolyglutamate synthase/dihydrofolate synthase family protein [Lysinibacillus sp.]
MINGLEHYKHTYKVESETVIKPGLANMERAMALLNEPQLAYKVIHVAGTNGKGSTVTYLKELAQLHGLRVGTFMSPGIIDVHDQIQIDGQNISAEQLGKIFEEMYDANISGICTDFELLTCAAFLHFRNEKVDVAIIEAGLGGRFDSTNVVQPSVCVIPSIALEHANFLGDTMESIAMHKAGIIKRDAIAVVGDVSQVVLPIFKKEAKKVGAICEQIGQQFTLDDSKYEDNIYSINALRTGMLGQHQLHNAALAIRAMSHLITLETSKVREAIAQASLPFRFEKVTDSLYFDGAHNPASVSVLVKTIQQLWPNREVQFIVGMLADKDIQQVLALLESVSDNFVFVDFTNERASTAQALMQMSNATNKRIEVNAVPYIVNRAQSNRLTVVTGSLYLLATIRQTVLSQLQSRK